MYSAICPNCGAAIFSASGGGMQFVLCGNCPWSGNATFHWLPGGALPNVSLVGIPGGMAPAPTDPPAPNPLDVRRDALRERLDEAAAEVNNELRCLAAADWDMPAWRRYERLQEAHARLFEALGGVRMGAYRPARAKLDAALVSVLVSVLVWALLTLDAVEG